MSFQEAKTIYSEIKGIFNSKLSLLHTSPQLQEGGTVVGIDFKKELQELPALGKQVEQHIVQLIEYYHKQPVLGKYVLDLFQLAEHCIQLTWDCFKTQSCFHKNFKHPGGKKYKFAFVCLYYLVQFRLFLQYHLVKEQINQDPVMLQYKAPAHHFSEEEIQSDFSENIPLPFKIALLDELGVFNSPKLKKLPQKKQREIIMMLIGGTDRQIKGNIAVLNPNSNEDRIRYTSYNYFEKVRKIFMN
ncbi:hypothetical protein ACW6QP_04335 [Salegentibacter sp. HM20]